jgi:UDP:flavonoid glycosyltransferase YjiC (YdhE family)
MARFLFVVPPLTGHVNPTVSVGHHLEKNGHQVAWVGYPRKVRPLLKEGAQLIGLDDRVYEQMEAGFADEAKKVRGLESLVFLWKKFLIPLARAMKSGVENAIDLFGPDVLIVDQQALAGAIVARRRRLRWATLATSAAGVLADPLGGLPKVWNFVLEQMALLQREAKLDPVERPDNSEELVLVFSTRELVGGGTFPEHFRFVGPSISKRPQETPFPWGKLQDTQRVLVSLGTVNVERGARFYKTVVDALTDQPLQCILVAPKILSKQAPDNFIIQDYVPQLKLLKKVDAVVCHAGQNTVSETLANGLPLIMTPIKDDQPIIATQVVNAGAGIRLKFGRLRSSDLRDAVLKILSDSSFRYSAEKIRESFRRAGGAERAARLLEVLL